MSAAHWRGLIKRVVADVWPQLEDGAAWIEAQVQAESGGKPDVRSGVGAIGLLQLMPATADYVGCSDPTDPEQNLRGGVRYLREQWEHLPEIPAEPHRLYWSFASYNAGRGWINRALAIARQDGEPYWWQWDIGSHSLAHKDCHDREGRYPDYRQVWGYVYAIRQYKAHPVMEAS